MEEICLLDRLSVPAEIQQSANNVASWVNSIVMTDEYKRNIRSIFIIDLQDEEDVMEYESYIQVCQFFGIVFAGLINQLKTTLHLQSCSTIKREFAAPALSMSVLKAIKDMQSAVIQALSIQTNSYDFNKANVIATLNDFATTIDDQVRDIHPSDILTLFDGFISACGECPTISRVHYDDVFYVLFAQFIDKLNYQDGLRMMESLVMRIEEVGEPNISLFPLTEKLNDNFNNAVEMTGTCPFCLHQKILDNRTVPDKEFETLLQVNVGHNPHLM